MVDMGMHFKPPKRRNRKQWAKVRLLLLNGYHFQGCPCCLRSERRGWIPPKSLGQAKMLTRR